MRTRSSGAILIQAEGLYKGVLADPSRHGPQAQALAEHARAAGEHEALVVALRAQAWWERSRLQSTRAKQILDDALAVAREHGLLERAHDLLLTRASVQVELGRLSAAQRDLDDAGAVPAARGPARAPDPDPEHLLAQAVLRHNEGDHARAARAYTRLLSLAPCPDEVTWKAANNAALVAAQRGRPDEAAALVRRAERAAQRCGPVAVAIVAQSRSWVLVQAGRLTESMLAFEQAEQLSARAGMPLGEHLLEHADALVQLRLVREARAVTERAVASLESADVPLVAAEARLREARLALLDGDVEAAVRAADAVVDSLRRQGRTGWLVRAQVTAVEARLARDDPSAAQLRALRRAASRLQELGLSTEAVDVRLLAGRVALRLGQRADAAQLLESVRRDAARGPVLLRMKGHLGAALAADAAGERGTLLRHARAGLQDLAVHRSALGSMELRVLASGHGAELGRLALRTQLQDGRPLSALAWMERTRAAAMAALEEGPGTEPVPAVPADAYQVELLTQLRWLHGEVERARAAGGGEPAGLRERIGEVEERLRRAAWARAASSRARTGSPVPVAELRRLLCGMPLVEHAALDGRLVAVVVEPRRSRLVDLGPVAEAQRERDGLLFALRGLGRSRGPAVAQALRRGADAGLRRLRELLIDPLGLGPDVPSVLVPSDALHGVPWAALHHAPVAVAPSASLWARTRRLAPTGGRVLLAAGPDLPGAAHEVRALSGLHPHATVLEPPASTVAAVTAALATSDLAHLACHGRLRADNPLFSALLLSDGPLTVHELALRGAAPRRVVLASCDSAADATYDGGEMLGFVSALIARGTAGLVASSVAVPDAGTVPLMCALHGELVRGASLSEALHGARGGLDVDDAAGFVSWAAYSAFGAA